MVRNLLTVAGLWLCLATAAGAQDTLGVFHSDPIQFFAGNSSRIWIGFGRFMMTEFSDTVIITADSARHSLQVRRVLVNEDDTVVVSRGRGSVGFTPGDTTIPLRWTESRYPQVTGRMRFSEGQWVLEFDGEWSQWSIRLAHQNDNAFAASVGRALGTLPPIMFTALTYQALPVKPKAARR